MKIQTHWKSSQNEKKNSNNILFKLCQNLSKYDLLETLSNTCSVKICKIQLLQNTIKIKLCILRPLCKIPGRAFGEPRQDGLQRCSVTILRMDTPRGAFARVLHFVLFVRVNPHMCSSGVAINRRARVRTDSLCDFAVTRVTWNLTNKITMYYTLSLIPGT